MNLKNQILAFDSDSKGSSKGIFCYRCGKPDRTLRNCPLPYTPALAYAPSRDKDGTVKKTMLAYMCEEEKTGDEKAKKMRRLFQTMLTQTRRPRFRWRMLLAKWMSETKKVHGFPNGLIKSAILGKLRFAKSFLTTHHMLCFALTQIP